METETAIIVTTDTTTIVVIPHHVPLAVRLAGMEVLINCLQDLNEG